MSGKKVNNEVKSQTSASVGGQAHIPAQRKGGFLKTLLKGYIEAYTTPNIYRVTLEGILILVVIIGIVILSYTGRIDALTTSVLIAFVLGFLFGKIK